MSKSESRRVPGFVGVIPTPDGGVPYVVGESGMLRIYTGPEKTAYYSMHSPGRDPNATSNTGKSKALDTKKE